MRLNLSALPRVSLIIPAHNEEKHLRACLQSVARQTVKPFEVIVVDNNSTDGTAAVARSFPFVRLVHKTKQGLVYARDAGFNAARGDVIGRIDADVLLPSDWTERIQAFYIRPENRDRIWSGAGRFYNVRPAWLVNWAYRLFAFDFNRLLLGHGSLWGSNMALRREQWHVLRHTTCLRTDIHEDLDLAIHAARKGYLITYDFSNRVSAELRRIHSDRQELWGYLQWWPRTLRSHGKKTWTICWFFGAFVLYLATFALVAMEQSMRVAEKMAEGRPVPKPTDAYFQE